MEEEGLDGLIDKSPASELLVQHVNRMSSRLRNMLAEDVVDIADDTGMKVVESRGASGIPNDDFSLSF